MNTVTGDIQSSDFLSDYGLLVRALQQLEQASTLEAVCATYVHVLGGEPD
jgi:hypothetical protein